MATIDERPFCRDCDGYISGGTGVDEPVCCCDSDDESDDQPTTSQIRATLTNELIRELAIICEEHGIPTPQEYELLPPDEQKLMFIKAEARLEVQHKRRMAQGAVRIVELEAELEAKGLLTEVELEAKTKKTKKIKLKLKPKKKVIKLKLKKKSVG